MVSKRLPIGKGDFADSRTLILAAVFPPDLADPPDPPGGRAPGYGFPLADPFTGRPWSDPDPDPENRPSVEDNYPVSPCCVGGDGSRAEFFPTRLVSTQTPCSSSAPAEESPLITDGRFLLVVGRGRDRIDGWEYRERVGRDGRRPGDDRGCDVANLSRLARELAYDGIQPTSDVLLAAGFAHACGRLGIDAESAAGCLVETHGQIQTSPEDNALVRAMQIAASDWRRFDLPGLKRETWRKAAALIYWLHRLRSDLQLVAVPTIPIGEWLGVDRKAAGSILRRLDKAGVIALQSGWSWKGRQARVCRYTGPAPAAISAAVKVAA